jgi:hypothetical protein
MDGARRATQEKHRPSSARLESSEQGGLEMDAAGGKGAARAHRAEGRAREQAPREKTEALERGEEYFG